MCMINNTSNYLYQFIRLLSEKFLKIQDSIMFIGDSCCNPLSLGWIKRILEREIEGVYVRSLMIGDNVVSDTEHGFFGNINEQIQQVCDKLANDEKLHDGYNAIGFSQGGLFLRGVAQRCSSPPMKNLISLGGPQQGIYGLPLCPGDVRVCDAVRHLLDMGAYIGFVQKSLIQAQYWHDPFDETTYKRYSAFLADANAENAMNQTYFDNLIKLNNFILVKFLNDSMVLPKESEWFGYYAQGNTSTIIPLEKSKLYTEDRIGLRTLNEKGKLQFVAIDGDHLQMPESVFIKEIVNKYLK
uniref:Palmitoyl-protein thioesterase 1 n=1 Tax=Parascaris univalens TaxID=6257 RepID=A0A915CDA1_PARUN